MKTIMKHQIKTIAIATLMMVVGAGCSKEKQIERRLEKGGTWNIDNITWSKVENGGPVQNVGTGTETNAGTFTFNKDGTGSYSYKLDGQQKSGTFTWSNGTSVISATVQSGSISQQVIVYTILSQSRTKFEIQGSEVINSTSGQYVMNATFNLST